MLREEQGASEEAEAWYRRAAEAGHEAAARKLRVEEATA
jgi:TPR repeat protein